MWENVCFFLNGKLAISPAVALCSLYQLYVFILFTLWHKVNFRKETSWFSSISFLCLIKAEEYSLPYYLPIVGKRTNGFKFFSGALALRKMQTASSMIWTRVADSISYEDNCYTKRIWTINSNHYFWSIAGIFQYNSRFKFYAWSFCFLLVKSFRHVYIKGSLSDVN